MNNKPIKIFIVGSKPDIVYPENISPDIVVGVNAAISRVQQYKERTKIYGVVSNYIFTEKNNDCLVAYDKIKNSYVNKLYVTALGTITNESRSKFNLTSFVNSEVEYLSEEKLNIGKNRYFNYKDIFNNYGFIASLKYLKFNFKGKKNRYTHISTGILALSIILEEFKSEKVEIYLLGIGIDPTSGHFYDKKQIISDYHLEKDKEFLKNVVKSNNNAKLYATDPLLFEYLDQLE